MTEANKNKKDSTSIFAEFHDIGKLINWKAVGLQKQKESGGWGPEPHEFEECLTPEWEIDLNAYPWHAIRCEEKDILKRPADSKIWAWTIIADWLAADWSRPLTDEEKKKKLKGDQKGYYCLWTGHEDKDPRLTEKAQLLDMIKFLNKSPSWQEAKEKYGDKWLKRPEEIMDGLNVTSLDSHSILTGKLAQVVSQVPSEKFPWSKPFKQFMNESLPKFNLIVMYFSVEIVQRPFRVSEWNIFSQRKESLKGTIEKFHSNIIYHSSNECIGVFITESQINELKNAITNAGFKIKYRILDDKAYKFTDFEKENPINIIDVINEKDKYEYCYLPDRIDIPICETCQMAHATHRWPADHLANESRLSQTSRNLLKESDWKSLEPDDFPESERDIIESRIDEGEENLCSACFELREQAAPLTKLREWNEGSIAWIHVHLDLIKLRTILTELHREYLRPRLTEEGLLTNLLDKVEARFPLIEDFRRDYDKYLHTFYSEIVKSFGEKNIEQVDDNLWCLHLDDKTDAMFVLEIHDKLMRERFPKLVEQKIKSPCPIHLRLSISHLKHPFFDHWRFLEKANNDISIQLVGSGIAQIQIKHLSGILEKLEQTTRHGLHRLGEIATISQLLAELVLKNKEDKDRKTFEAINRMLDEHKLDFESIITLSNLMKGGKSHGQDKQQGTGVSALRTEI